MPDSSLQPKHIGMDLLGMFASKRSPARFPQGRVGYAVGDIHGRADLLVQMCAELEKRANADVREGGAPIVIFMGDYVDRGPQSAHVIHLLLSGRPIGFERRFLKGNHEQSMLAFLAAPMLNRAWVLQGGAETLASYGVTPPSPLHAGEADWLAAAEKLGKRLPPEHKTFLESLERYVELGGYAFVHAGVSRGRRLEKQTDADLFWARQQFLNDKRRFSHRVVHGHTPVEKPYADEQRVAVDTGAYATGVLTAARFEAEAVSFISVGPNGPIAPS